MSVEFILKPHKLTFVFLETLIKQLGTISIHVVYLMVGMLCLIFVNAEMLSRVLFLLIVFLNMVAVSYQLIQLDISTLTQTIAVVLGSKVHKYLSFGLA